MADAGIGRTEEDFWPQSLRAEALMTYMRGLCKEIGPRPPTSIQERRAADYVRTILQTMGYRDIREHPFKSQPSYGWILMPVGVLAALGMPIAAWLGQWGKLLGGLGCLGSAYTLHGFTRARFPVFQALISRGISQNLQVDISPTDEVKRRVFLISHLDTQKQRFMAPPPYPGLMKPMMTVSVLLTALAGGSLLADVLAKRKGLRRWQWLVAGGLLSTVLSAWLDEAQPHVEGASDNASGVSILLGIAAALQEAPLKYTQVTLLFTGCEEPVCVGIERYLRDVRPPREDTYWIDLDMLGAGNVCYATKQGISYLAEYSPDAELVQTAARTARRYPALDVVGREMLTLDEVSNLRDHGYKALLITVYGEDGWLPHWHRLSDTLENIDPSTMQCAAYYAWALLHELDGS